ncbi:MAG: hypothetical protein JRC60_06295 [Deltaproteobacteria bacterium]|nr:hypothetical protein [Deltaproteobacteria bacterium]
MHYKTNKNESAQVTKDRRAAPLEPEKDQHKESIITTLPDKNGADDFAGKKPEDAGLSEKFFLSDFPED